MMGSLHVDELTSLQVAC